MQAIVTAQMLIRKPAPEVFEAFIDPDITRHFWFTKASGRRAQIPLSVLSVGAARL